MALLCQAKDHPATPHQWRAPSYTTWPEVDRVHEEQKGPNARFAGVWPYWGDLPFPRKRVTAR